MMSEEKKAADLEFITVEAADVEGAATDAASTASASTKKSKSKTEDGEALGSQCACNVTGRLLVGLRWWNRINEDGTNEWIFESHEDMTEIDALDSQVFWGGLYGTPVVWVFLLIIAVLKFNVQWALIVVIAVMLSSANIIGYTKCKKDAKQKMHSLMSQGALGALSTSAGSSLMSTIGGFALGGVTSSREKKQQPVTV
ncbi:Ribosephosphate pyrophosphokinase, partial [Globisporangium splendens]